MTHTQTITVTLHCLLCLQARIIPFHFYYVHALSINRYFCLTFHSFRTSVKNKYCSVLLPELTKFVPHVSVPEIWSKEDTKTFVWLKMFYFTNTNMFIEIVKRKNPTTTAINYWTEICRNFVHFQKLVCLWFFGECNLLIWSEWKYLHGMYSD